MKIPLSTPKVTEEMKKVAIEVMDSRRYIKGPKVLEFEEKFAKYCGTSHGSAVSNGTSAIYLALKAIGVGPGDEVIVPSFTFVASATPILFAGAKPIFVEIGEDYLIDTKDLEKKITPKTKAVICVHLYGQMCDMDALMELKRKHGFSIVEDACQAHGAEFKGKKAGSFGDVGCFSFFPSKNMTVCGDGGMTVTSDDGIKKRIDMLRDHGRDYSTKEGKFKSTVLGFNFRMSEISAAIGIEQLKSLDDWIDSRRKIAKVYDSSLTDKLIKPSENKNCKHAYHLYVVRTQKRDELKNHLSKNEIETGIHYPLPIHEQPIFHGKWNLPLTEKFCNQILSLPMYPNLKADEIKFICDKTNEFSKEEL